MKLYECYCRLIFAILSIIFVNILTCQTQFIRTLSSHERQQYKEKVTSMFYHAYDSYLHYASGHDELMPISCSGMNTWGTFSLSLIDALDTLAVMGNHSEFRRVANHILETASFESNTNVSVFETNIRVLGGLLSAHLLSKRTGMDLEPGWPCDGPLLRLAEKVGKKLLPAFDTKTGMPYGTVNFLYGVPENETPVTCVAGVGTFVVEFVTLSRLTGNSIYEERAMLAIEGLQKYRSKIGLIGNHINVQDGSWFATEAGIGAGVDSYFEYLVKGAMLMRLPYLQNLMSYEYQLIKKHIKRDDWYMWVSMATGQTTMPIFQSLEAFFPGMLVLMGDIDQAKGSLYNYHQIWKQYGFVPEFHNIVENKLHKRDGYPLRPEFIESVMYLYRATRDPHLLSIGADVVDSILHSARTECGFATIKTVADHTIEDRMESFFLAETLKYLYLLFDDGNFIHSNGRTGQIHDFVRNGKPQSCVLDAGGYVFNTEAHPIDMSAVDCCSKWQPTHNLVDSLTPFHKASFRFNIDDLISLSDEHDNRHLQSLLQSQSEDDNNSTESSSESMKSPESMDSIDSMFDTKELFSQNFDSPLYCPAQTFLTRLSLYGEQLINK